MQLVDVQNAFLFPIVIFVAYLWIYNNAIGQKEDVWVIDMYNFIWPIIILYVFVDSFYHVKREVRVRRELVLFLAVCVYYLNVSSMDIYWVGSTLINTEISSIFLCLKYYIPETSPFFKINSALFYLSFAKFRIYDMYQYLITQDHGMDYFLEKYSPKSQISSQIIFICYNAFFLLNIYWFILIHKVLFKSILKKMGDLQQMLWSEYLCRYTFFLNVPICIYLYSMDGNQRYIFDVIGIITMSVMSYKFHRRLYLQMKNGEIITNEILHLDNMFEYVNDHIAIHLRSFFGVVSGYYDTNRTNGVIAISMLIHLCSFYNMVLNIIYLYKDYNHNKLFFQKINMICISICVAFDIFSIYMNTNEKKIAFPFLIVGITMFMVLVMKPFYHLTHTAFHVLLILNTYYTCLSNISV